MKVKGRGGEAGGWDVRVKVGWGEAGGGYVRAGHWQCHQILHCHSSVHAANAPALCLLTGPPSQTPHNYSQLITKTRSVAETVLTPLSTLRGSLIPLTIQY